MDAQKNRTEEEKKLVLLIWQALQWNHNYVMCWSAYMKQELQMADLCMEREREEFKSVP